MEIHHKRTALLGADDIRRLSRRSDGAGAVRLTAHVGLWLATLLVTGAAIGTGYVVPAMVLQGIVQVALFAGLHETVHRTAFRSRRLNVAVASLIGLVHGLPAGFFRRFHFAHHRFTQDPARDPELSSPKPETRRHYVLYLTAWVYWRDRSRELVRHALGRVTAPFVPVAERGQVSREARWHLALYAGVVIVSVGLGRAEAFYLWLGPALLGQPLLRLYLLAEHTGAALNDDMLANTRTTYGSAVIRFLMWNMPYHTEHHMYPAVPFHALARLNRALAPHLEVTAPGYGATHRRYWRALRAGDGARFTHGRM